MKICIGYKGFFLYKRVLSEGLTQNTISFAKEILENHQEMLHNDLANNEIDYYFSTYNVSEQLDQLYMERLNPKVYSYLPSQFFRHPSTWVVQLNHYKNLISLIRESKIEYDLFIFTRPDIQIVKKFSELIWKNLILSYNTHLLQFILLKIVMITFGFFQKIILINLKSVLIYY